LKGLNPRDLQAFQDVSPARSAGKQTLPPARRSRPGKLAGPGGASLGYDCASYRSPNIKNDERSFSSRAFANVFEEVR
jgi:hypothetical protein